MLNVWHRLCTLVGECRSNDANVAEYWMLVNQGLQNQARLNLRICRICSKGSTRPAPPCRGALAFPLAFPPLAFPPGDEHYPPAVNTHSGDEHYSKIYAKSFGKT